MNIIMWVVALGMIFCASMEVCHVVDGMIQNCRIILENEGHMLVKQFVQGYWINLEHTEAQE
jgi:hypothetical protein